MHFCNRTSRGLIGTLMVLALSGPALPVSDASAASFKNGDLFVGKPIKQDSDDRTFAFGVGFSIAPVKALIKSQANKALDTYAASNPEAAALKDYIQYADTEQMRALADSGQLEAFKAALKDELKKNGGTLSADQEAQINAIDEGKLRTMADMIEIMQDPDDTLTFGIEPWVAFNLKYLQIKANIAVAGYNNTAGTSFQLGNLGLELSTGASHGPIGKTFGWTLGVRGYAPTGTTDANAMAIANVLTTPRFLHEYATVSPFGVLGLDFGIVQWTVHGEYVHMLAVRTNDVSVKDMAYAQAGTGLLLYLNFVGVSVELDGLFDVNNAPMMSNSWLLTTGLRGYVGPLQVGGAVQIPLVQPGSKDERFNYGGVATGSPADINFLVQAQMQF